MKNSLNFANTCLRVVDTRRPWATSSLAILSMDPFSLLISPLPEFKNAHCVYAKARAEDKLELASSRARPEIEDNSVWLDFVPAVGSL
jgi:hypothetical protein